MPEEGIVPFERIIVKFSPLGVTRVEWELSTLFSDPGPYVFTLQGAQSSVETANFINIGSPSTNTWFLNDDNVRVFGKTPDWSYRVKLVTAIRTYYSPAASLDSGVDYRTWRIAREIIRKEKLRMSKFTGIIDARLFKRKRNGTKCTRCADYLTDETTDGNCSVCLGTGIINGYFSAVPILIELPTTSEIEKIELDARGTISQGTVANCRIIGDSVKSQDVIWDVNSGRRYIIHESTELVTVRGYNIVASVNLRISPYTDVVYTIPEEGI
jgi:hypothetical protein